MQSIFGLLDDALSYLTIERSSVAFVMIVADGVIKSNSADGKKFQLLLDTTFALPDSSIH